MGFSAALLCRLAGTSLAQPVLRATTRCSPAKHIQQPLAQSRSAMAEAALEESVSEERNTSSSLHNAHITEDHAEIIEPPLPKQTHDWDPVLGVDQPSSRMEPVPPPEPKPVVESATQLHVASKKNFVYSLLGEPWASSRMTDALDSCLSVTEDAASKSVGTLTKQSLSIRSRRPPGPRPFHPNGVGNSKNGSPSRRQSPKRPNSRSPGGDPRGFDPRLLHPMHKPFGRGSKIVSGQHIISDDINTWAKNETTKSYLNPMSAIAFARYEYEKDELEYVDDYGSPRRIVEYSEPIDLPENSYVYSAARLFASRRRLQ